MYQVVAEGVYGVKPKMYTMCQLKVCTRTKQVSAEGVYMAKGVHRVSVEGANRAKLRVCTKYQLKVCTWRSRKCTTSIS
jgi:hypothetical protein